MDRGFALRWQTMEHSAPLRFNDQVRAWLQPALDLFETHTIEDVEQSVASGHMQLWAGERGALVTQIITYPRKKVLHVFIAGGEMDQVLDFLPSLHLWADMQDCDTLTLSGRVGWKRVLADHGWRQEGITMICEQGAPQWAA